MQTNFSGDPFGSVCSKCNLIVNDAVKTHLCKPGALKFDQGKSPMELLSPQAIEGLVNVLAFGARKYAPNNWKQGLTYSRVTAAILRHTFAILRGELYDPETGLAHADHVQCEAMFLSHFMKTGTGTDDLTVKENSANIEYGGLK